MSLFSRIDRIRGGRGEADREDDSVFAIPDLGKAGSPSPSPAPQSPPPAAPPAPEAAAPPPAAPAAATPAAPVPDTAAPGNAEAPPKRLSPLERLARRSAEVEEEAESGSLPDPVVPERPAMSQLAERLDAEPLEDVAAAPIARMAEDEENPATMDADEEVPLPNSPFRRPSLFNDSKSNAASSEQVGPREPVSPGAWAGLTVPPSPDDEEEEEETTPEPENAAEAAPTSESEVADDEAAPPAFEAVTLPPNESDATSASVAPVEEAVPAAPAAPVTPPAPSSGGTAFDRLMAARANADAPRTSTPSLADRLKAMRANAAAQSRPPPAPTPNRKVTLPKGLRNPDWYNLPKSHPKRMCPSTPKRAWKMCCHLLKATKIAKMKRPLQNQKRKPNPEGNLRTPLAREVDNRRSLCLHRA